MRLRGGTETVSRRCHYLQMKYIQPVEKKSSWRARKHFFKAQNLLFQTPNEMLRPKRA